MSRNQRRAVFVIAVLVVFVGLSIVADRSAGPLRIKTGTVTAWRAGECIAVANEQTDPGGFEMKLRATTAYEVDTLSIKPGVRVTVWYRNVGERRFVVDRVRVLETARY